MIREQEELRERALARGLTRVGELIANFRTPEAFGWTAIPLDPRLVAEPNLGPHDRITQLVRRGLQPVLVQGLMTWLQDRPLELALVAWDTLTSSLLADDDPLYDELRRAARPLAAVLPAPGTRGIDLNRHPSDALLSRFAVTANLSVAKTIELLPGAYEQSLGAFAELKQRGDELIEKQRTQVSIHAFAKVLHLAHLPTLAAVYLDYLQRVLGYRPAALDLCETLLDAHAPERIPGDALKKGDLPQAELTDFFEYLIYRSHMALGRSEDAHALHEGNLQKRAQLPLPPPTAHLTIVRAHLATFFGKRGVPLEELDAICSAQPAWRYAARARVTVAAAVSPPTSMTPLAHLRDFVDGFGNDFDCWYDALVAAPGDAGWKREGFRLLAREAHHLPHEASVWKPIVMFTGDKKNIQAAAQQIDERLVRQSTL